MKTARLSCQGCQIKKDCTYMNIRELNTLRHEQNKKGKEEVDRATSL